MTKRAEELALKAVNEALDNRMYTNSEFDAVKKYIDQAITETIERCAKVADTYTKAQRISQAIRALNDKEK